MTEFPVTIQNHLAAGRGICQCFPELLHYPQARWMLRHVEMKNSASTVLDDEETVKDPEGENRHREQVHRCDELAVIAQESGSELTRLVPGIQFPDIPGNGAFGHVEAEFEKLTVNSWSTPSRILVHHAHDETSKPLIDPGPANTLCARAQALEQTEAGSMLGDNSLRLYDSQDIPPGRPNAGEQYPEHPVLDSQRGVGMFSLENAELLTEGKDLKTEVATGTKEGAEEGMKQNHSPRFRARGLSLRQP